MRRCSWAETDSLLGRYHDTEWGWPQRGGKKLFEALTLDGAQAGLSWLTILRKRPAYRRAFAGFSPQRVARFTAADERRLLADPGIVRNRAKIRSAIVNARAYLAYERQHGRGSFGRLLWSFVGNVPKVSRYRTWTDIPAVTPESEAMGKALRTAGFTFVGPTICYAFMQGVGMVNDHTVGCWVGEEIRTQYTVHRTRNR